MTLIASSPSGPPGGRPHRLKDLDRPERLFQVVADGLPSEFPPPAAEPGHADAIVEGRERELAEAAGAAVAFGRRDSSRAARHPALARLLGGRRRRLTLAVLAVVALGLAATAAAVALRDDGGGTTIVPNSLVKIDVRTNEVVDVVPVGVDPGQLEIVDGAVFVASQASHTLTRVQMETGEVETSGDHVAGGPLAAWGKDRLCVTSEEQAKIIPVLGETLDVIGRPIPIDKSLGHAFVAVGGGSLWVSQFHPAALSRWNLRSRSRQKRYELGEAEIPIQVTFAAGAAWVALSQSSALLRVDARSCDATEVRVGPGPSDPTFGFDSLWVSSFWEDKLFRLDPYTGATREVIPTGRAGHGVAVGAGSVWVANYCDGTISRIDPTKEEAVATIRTGFFPKWVAVGGGYVWVALAATDTLTFNCVPRS